MRLDVKMIHPHAYLCFIILGRHFFRINISQYESLDRNHIIFQNSSAKMFKALKVIHIFEQTLINVFYVFYYISHQM